MYESLSHWPLLLPIVVLKYGDPQCSGVLLALVVSRYAYEE